MLKYFFAITLLIAGPTAWAQNYLARTVKEYFRVDPFQGGFSTFVQTLTNDSALLNKKVLLQTDTTGYFVKGEYAIFNPYSINANKVDMLFYESSYRANSRVLLNYYTYQLTAFFPDTELARRAIVKDYAKLIKKIRKELYDTKKQSLKGYNNIEDGEITSFNSNFPLEPVIVSWQTLDKTRQLGLTILLRLRQLNNYAYPVNFNSRLGSSW